MTHSGKKRSIAVIGGGTGTYTVLRGLKKYAGEIDISAIISMADSGGSTGRLRDEFGYLPVGDVRMALSALAKDDGEHEELMRELFQYRFDKGEGLNGHNFGNLLLVALTSILGSETEAVKTASKILRIHGRVLPVTDQDVHIVAEYDDGSVQKGEHAIDDPIPVFHDRRIVRLYTEPACTITSEAKEAIKNADLILLGPGDLYSSLLANCVVGGVADAIASSPGRFVFISNLMTRPGQTRGMTTADYIDEIDRYVGRQPDCIFINDTKLPEDIVLRYKAEGDLPVVDTLAETDIQIIRGDFLAEEEARQRSGDVLKRSLLRHDGDTLAAAIRGVLLEK